MHENIVLIGGGKHAFSLLDLLTGSKPEYRIAGYVDVSKTGLSIPYLGNDSQFFQNKKNAPGKVVVVMCIGIDIALREKIFTTFRSKGYRFLTYAHSSSVISCTAEMREGSIVFPSCVIGPAVKIGKNVCIHSGVVVEHRTVIGDHSYISPGVSIAGECRIGDSSFVGIHAGISDSVSLEEKTVVGAGAMVLKSFHKSGITIAGVPARVLKR